MPLPPCPECGHSAPVEATACPNCGHVLATGIVPQGKNPREKPPLPPELNGWVPEPTPPELLEEMRRTFNEQEFLADVREIERTGGVKFEDFIGEIEDLVNRRE
jgi:hypothetical protein